ncbi:MAG: permease-like cell division protein FtsX [Acidimicrobiales bacterium]|nr:permease-like cell division protein FtsX [Acidimicrobiales bacterium]
MPVSLDYVARETASNLWRNRLMTIAAVLTVGVSLSLVGASLLLRQGVAHATTQWAHGVDAIVWLKPGIADSQRVSVQKQVEQLPFVRSVTYRSQGYDLNEAKHLLTPPEYQVLTVDTTPASLRVQLDNPSEASAIARQFGTYPGVKSVNVPTKQIHNIQEVSRILQLVFFVLAVILLLSASVLIINTIRLAIFARRREVSVMKLVGATNWFIRVPFMFEGVAQGLFGALFASLTVFSLHFLLDSFSNTKTGNIWYQMRMPTGEVIVTSLVVVLIGVVIGSFGSFLGIRRFLDA